MTEHRTFKYEGEQGNEGFNPGGILAGNGEKGRVSKGPEGFCGVSDDIGASQGGGVEAVVKAQVVSGAGDAYFDLHVLGRAVFGASRELSVRYLALCDYIILCQFSPKEVTKELLSVGLDPVRISEVKAVCFTSREIYAEFKARLVGWKATLRRIRQGTLTADQRRQRQLQRVANQFEKVDLGQGVKLFHHEGNGRCMLMWFRRDVLESKVFNFDGCRVSVKYLVKTPKIKANKNQAI